MRKQKLPQFVEGVRQTINCLHFKLPYVPNGGTIVIAGMLIGYATDVVTANHYRYTFEWDPDQDEYRAIKI